MGVSRRDVIGAASVAPLVASCSKRVPDQATKISERWLLANAEADRLQCQWGKLENHLVQHHGWYDLTERQRCMLPAAQELFDIDERIERLHAQCAAMLRCLPTLEATSRTALAAKLAVAAIVISPEDNEDAYTLVASILRDLNVMPAGVV